MIEVVICPDNIDLLPFTGFALAEAVIVSEKVFSIHAENFFSWCNVTEYLHARPIAPSGHKLIINKIFNCSR